MKHFALLLSLALLLTSCTDPYELNFTLLLPQDSGFTDSLHRITITHGDTVKELQVQGGEISINTKFKVDVGAIGRITIKGYDASDNLIAAGHTPPFTAVDAVDILNVFFNEINTLGVLHTNFSGAITQNQAIPLRGSVYEGANQVGGHIFMGGTRDGTLMNQVIYYDPWFHDTIPLSNLQEPALGMAIMPVSSSILLLYGGVLQSGELSDSLWYYPASCLSCGGYELFFPENAPPPMANATVIELGPFTALYNELDQSKLVNAFLLMGGTTDEGIDTQIHLIKVYLDASSSVLSITTESIEWPNARADFAAVVANKTAEDTLYIGVHGGDGPAEVIELGVHSFSDGLDFTFDFTDITSDATLYNPLPIVTGAGNILFLSGVSADGTPLDTIYRMDPRNFTMEPVSTATITPHHRGAAVRVGSVILISGGLDAEGLSTSAQVLKISESDTSFNLQTQADLSVTYPRIAPHLLMLPTGDIGVCGGEDEDGDPVVPYEIFTPNPLDSGEPQPL